jgi:hypothetical protein
MSIDAVLPAMGGIGILLTGIASMLAVTTGNNVGAGVAPTGKLACAGPLRTVCVVHGLGVGAGVTAATVGAIDDSAAGGLDVPHPTAMSVTAVNARACLI